MIENKLIELNDKIIKLKIGGTLMDHIDEIKLDCSDEQKKVILFALQKLIISNKSLFDTIKVKFQKQYHCSNDTIEFIEKICLNENKLDIEQIKKLQDDIADILFNYFDGVLSRKNFYSTVKRKLLMLNIKDNHEILCHIDALYKEKYNISMII